MNIDPNFLYYLGQKTAFYLVHKTTIWVLLVFFITAGITWHLSNILYKHNARQRDASFAGKIALAYIAIPIVLWLFSFIMS